VGVRTVVAAATAVLCAGLASAQTTPSPSENFVSNVTYSFMAGGKLSVSKGYMWYDLATNTKRSDHQDSGVPFTMLELYKKNQIDWIWHTSPAPECSVEQVFGPVSVDMWDWLPMAQYAGEDTIDDVATYVWQYNDSWVPQTLWVSQSDSNLPVRLLVGGLGGDYNQYDFTDFTDATPDPDVFNIPSFCQQPLSGPARAPVPMPRKGGSSNGKGIVQSGSKGWECTACEAAVETVIFAACTLGSGACGAFEPACDIVCESACFAAGCAEQACTSCSFCP